MGQIQIAIEEFLNHSKSDFQLTEITKDLQISLWRKKTFVTCYFYNRINNEFLGREDYPNTLFY